MPSRENPSNSSRFTDGVSFACLVETLAKPQPYLLFSALGEGRLAGGVPAGDHFVNTPSSITKLKSLAALAAALFTVSLAGFGSQVSAQSGPIVNVSTEGELQQAIVAISSDTTILISPGTYHLTSTLTINKPVTNVVLRGATENPNDVVISGRGMDNANFEAVPHGISTGVGVTGITIANLTVRDVYYHAIMLAPGTESPRIQNVRLINAGRQFVKAYPDGKGGGVDEGLIERSMFEYTGTSRDSDTGGLEVHTGGRWTVRDNIFRNIVAPTGQVAGPAILFWTARATRSSSATPSSTRSGRSRSARRIARRTTTAAAWSATISSIARAVSRAVSQRSTSPTRRTRRSCTTRFSVTARRHR